MKNYYQTLGVSRDSSIIEIKTAYRKLSKKFHPDVNNGDIFFEELFKEIQEAYEILSNPTKRAKYDTERYERNSNPSHHQQKKRESESNKNTTNYNKSDRNTKKASTGPIRKQKGSNFWNIIIFILIGGFIYAIFKNQDKNTKTSIQNSNTYLSTSHQPIDPVDSGEIVNKRNMPSISSLLHGKWVGTAHQYDINETWDFEILGEKDRYTVKYPSLGCGGTWILVKKYSHTMLFQEEISYGKEICNNGGMITITYDETGELRMSYYYPNENVLNASGIMRKRSH